MNLNVIISSILWIILVLVIVILLILLLPIKVTTIHECGKWKIDLKILFFSIDLSRTSQIGDDELRKKTVKKSDSYHKNFEIDFEGVDNICDFFCLLGMIIKTAKKIVILAIKKLTVENLTFKIAVGSENSAEVAINYGRISSVVYPIAVWLIDLNEPKNYSVSVSPDFLSSEINFRLKLCVKTKIWNLLILVIEILRNLKIK